MANPDELLVQISDLMQQYLALGPETPAFDSVSNALPEIQQAAAGAGAPALPGGDAESPMEDAAEPAEEPGDMGGSPLPPGPPMDAGAGLPPEATGPPMDGPKNFADASALALEDLKKKKAKA